MGLFVVLAGVLLAAIAPAAPAAPLSPIVRETPGPVEILTVAQSTTVPGWQITISLNCLRFSPASACEYAMPAPGTRRMVADVTITPAGSAGFIPSSRFFGLVDTGEYRHSLRLLAFGLDGPMPAGSLPAGGPGRGPSLPGDTGTPGTKYSLGIFSQGLWGRIVHDRIDEPQPVQV